MSSYQMISRYRGVLVSDFQGPEPSSDDCHDSAWPFAGARIDDEQATGDRRTYPIIDRYITPLTIYSMKSSRSRLCQSVGPDDDDTPSNAGLQRLSLRQNLLTDARQLSDSSFKACKASILRCSLLRRMGSVLLHMYSFARTSHGPDMLLLCVVALQSLILHDNQLTQVILDLHDSPLSSFQSSSQSSLSVRLHVAMR